MYMLIEGCKRLRIDFDNILSLYFILLISESFCVIDFFNSKEHIFSMDISRHTLEVCRPQVLAEKRCAVY